MLKVFIAWLICPFPLLVFAQPKQHTILTEKINNHFIDSACYFSQRFDFHCLNNQWNIIDLWGFGANDTSLYFAYVKDSSQPLYWRIYLLAQLQTQFKIASQKHFDTQFLKNICLQALNKHEIEKNVFDCFRVEIIGKKGKYEKQLTNTNSAIANLLISLGDDIVPDLYKIFKTDTNTQLFRCYYCPNAVRCGQIYTKKDWTIYFLHKITKSPFPFKILDTDVSISLNEYFEGKDCFKVIPAAKKELINLQELAFDSFIKLYCAQRGISLK